VNPVRSRHILTLSSRYSMGGMIPTYLASTSPSRVTAAILIGPVHPTPTVSDVFKNRIPLVQQQGMEAMANSIPNGATGPNTTALQKAFIREMIMAQKPEGYMANCRAIQFASPPEYGKVECPVLILGGSVDKSTPVEGCEVIYKGLGTEQGRKRLVVLDSCGHWYCVERGEEVGRLVREFCEGL
jgi:pimeloyl-ACP methyl ester carboxylesterase